MEAIRIILLILHFVGLASLLGGFMVQMKGMRTGDVVINPAMLHGVLTQLVTGLLLVGVVEMGDLHPMNHVKIGVKLAITVIVAVLVFVSRKRERVSVPVFGAIGALTLANIVIAVAWH